VAGVIAGGCGVVDGAWADDDKKARIAAGEDVADLGACGEDGRRGSLRDRKLFFEKYWRKDDLRPPDPEIICAVRGVHAKNRTWAGGAELRGMIPRKSLCFQCIRLG
jgi:hypothetical protein